MNPSAPPTITSISPTSGPVGTTVTIYGSGFMDLTSLEFTGGVYSGATYNETMIVTTVPTGAMTGPITVNSSYGSAMSSTFTVTP